MDAVSSIGLVQEKAQIHKKTLIDILNDPKKTLYFMLTLAVVGSVVVVLFFSVSNNLNATKEVTKFQQTKVVEEIVKIDFDSKRQQDVELINSAVKSYFSKNQTYPQSISTLIPQYLAVVPRDPETQKEYYYRVSLDFKSYEVWTKLDNGEEYLLSN